MSDGTDNRKAILIGGCIQAAAQIVAAGRFGDEDGPEYPADAVAQLARRIMDEILEDAVAASGET
jgi:hypothetical protein